MRENYLEALYHNFSHEPGWLRKLSDRGFIWGDDGDYLSWLDNNSRLHQANKIIPDIEEDQMYSIIELVIDIQKKYEAMRMAGTSWFERRLYLELNNYEELLKKEKRIQAKIYHTKFPHTQEITEADIEKARAVPLDEIVEPNKQKMITCLWHEDGSPSLYVSKGFGYCFACGAWCDSIKYWMEKNNRNFVDTVKSLIRF